MADLSHAIVVEIPPQNGHPMIVVQPDRATGKVWRMKATETGDYVRDVEVRFNKAHGWFLEVDANGNDILPAKPKRAYTKRKKSVFKRLLGVFR